VERKERRKAWTPPTHTHFLAFMLELTLGTYMAGRKPSLVSHG
jgi:hypothetical protein